VVDEGLFLDDLAEGVLMTHDGFDAHDCKVVSSPVGRCVGWSGAEEVGRLV